jgi:signal transduction histidine kinase
MPAVNSPRRSYTPGYMPSFPGLARGRVAWSLVTTMLVVAWLGWQQHKWIGRVAEVEARVSREKLATSLKLFANDFDTEITRAYLAFTGLSGRSVPDVLEQARARQRLLTEVSSFPGLVGSVDAQEGIPNPYDVDPGPPPGFDVPAIWEQPSGASPGTQAFAVQPFFDTTMGPQTRVATGMGLQPRRTPLRIRVALDQQYITTVLFPRLFERHFPSNTGQNYDALVVSQASGGVIVHMGSAASQPWEASLAILAIRPDCLAERQMERSSVATRPMVPESPVLPLRRPGRCIDVMPPGPAAWTVNVRMRPPIGEAVDSARRRNLLISAGVLFVLALAMVVLFVNAHRARELAELHERFAAGISHELRTPLSVLSSASQNLADGVVEDRDQVQQYGKMIHAHSQQLSAMIENALWFAQRQAGELETQEVCVEDLVGTAAGTCGRMLDEVGVSLEREIEPGLPGIRGNRTLLLHGLQNLLTNIARYGRAGKWARVAAARDGNNVKFTVEDGGDGMTPAEVARAFEPFFRGKRNKQMNLAGLGLGLSLVRRIIEAHGGRIELRSERNRGTTVVFTIPVFESGDVQAHSGME